MKLLVMVWLAANRRFPALRRWVREILAISLRCLLPENSIDERVFSSVVGIWKVRRGISVPSLNSGVVEL